MACCLIFVYNIPKLKFWFIYGFALKVKQIRLHNFKNQDVREDNKSTTLIYSAVVLWSSYRTVPQVLILYFWWPSLVACSMCVQAVRDLSCLARDLQMYMVIDMAEQAPCVPEDTSCRPSGLNFFNTQVVFDRSGAVIARWVWVGAVLGGPAYN